MARADRILTPDKILVTASLNATTAASAQAVGQNKTFSISATGNVHILFGASGVAAPDATSGLVLPTGLHVLHSGDRFTHVRVYNPGASAITYSIAEYSNL